MLLALQLNNLLESEAENDTTPDPFTFIDQAGVATSSTITSAAVAIAGIDAAAAITVTGGTYDIDSSGTFTADAGTVTVGQTVRARHTSSASYLTATNTVVTIGGVSDTFSSVTGATPITFTSLINIVDEGNEVYAATAAGTSNTAQGLIGEVTLPNVESWIECQRPDTGDASTVLAWDPVATAQTFGANDYIAQVNTAGSVFRGQNTSSLTDTGYVLPAGVDSRLRLHRSAANVVSVQTSTDGGSNWTVQYTFAGTNTLVFRTHIYTSWVTTTRKIYQPRQYGLVIITRYAADGNSQTVGVNGAGASFPNQLAVLLGRPVTNYGVGSQTTQDMIDDADTQIDANLQSVGPNVLIVGEIRNHLTALGAGATARIGVDLMWTYCDGRKAAAALAGKSLRIVLWNILPAGVTSSPIGITALNAMFVEANALLAAEWRSHVDAYVDVRSETELTDPDNATYFTDTVHLTEAGDTVLANLIFSGIQAAESGSSGTHFAPAGRGGMMVFG